MFIKQLLVESLESPIGIDSKNPHLSWILSSTGNERGKMQSAFQVLVSSNRESTRQ